MIAMPVNQKESVVIGAEKSNAFVSPKRKRLTQEILDIPSFSLALPTTTTSTETKTNLNTSDKLKALKPTSKNKSHFQSEKKNICTEQSSSKPSSLGQTNTFVSSYPYNRSLRIPALTPKRHRNLSETKPPINFQDKNSLNMFSPSLPKRNKDKEEKESVSKLQKDEVNAPESPLYSPFRFNSFPDSLPRVNPRSVRPLFTSNKKNVTDRDGPESFGRVLFNSSGDIPDFSPPKHNDCLKEKITPHERKHYNFSIGLSSSSFQPSTKKKTIIRKETTVNSFKNFIEGNKSINSFQRHEVDVPYSQSWTSRQEGATDTSHDTSISSISATSPSSINGSMAITQNLLSPMVLPLHEKEDECGDYIHDHSKKEQKISVQYANDSEIGFPPLIVEKVKGTRLNFNSLLSPRPKGAVSEKAEEMHEDKVDDTLKFGPLQPPSNFDGSHEQINSRMHIGQLPSSTCSPICNEDDESCALVLDVDFPSLGATHTAASDATTEDTTFFRENNFSTLSSSRLSISPSSRSRSLRPMPDMTAFDGTTSRISRRLSLSMNDNLQSSSPPKRFVCPPTPWRYRCSPKLTRQEVLATCPPQILDSLTSFDTSVDENMNISTTSSFGNIPLHGELLNSSGSTCNEDSKNRSLLKVSGDKTRNSNDQNFDSHSKNIIKPIEARHLSETVSFNDFENLGQIGQGSFADVFKVKCKVDNCLYAVKRNRRQFRGKRDRDLALVEVHTMQRLQSEKKVCPYLLLFVRAWQEDGYFFCQTELCSTDNCRHMLLSLRSNWRGSSRRHPNMSDNMSPNGSVDPSSRLTPESTVWKIFHDVAAGLLHIHSHGLVHFDIKPSNIFFVPHSKLGCICKIGDFGMAGEIGSSEDGQEGDNKYMPQEVLSTAVKHPSADIFSLGLTIYELSSDVQWELPSDGPRWHEIRDGKHPINLPSSRSKELFTSIQMMIHPDRLKRPTADQILNDFSKINEAGIMHNVFLADYLRDVQDLEFERERREASFRRSTPTSSINMSNGERTWNVRTPTPDSSNIHFFPVQNSK